MLPLEVVDFAAVSAWANDFSTLLIEGFFPGLFYLGAEVLVRADQIRLSMQLQM